MRRTLLIVCSVMLTVILASDGVATAHAALVRADPKPGSKLMHAPKVVRAIFSEELDPKGSTISVWDSHTKSVAAGKGGLDRSDKKARTMIVRLKPLGSGTYTVKWKAVTADDNETTEGTFQFTVTK